MLFLTHIYLIPLFPALGAALMFFFGRKLQKATVSAVCVGSVVLAFLMSCGAVLQYTNWAPATRSPALRKNSLHLARHRHRPPELRHITTAPRLRFKPTPDSCSTRSPASGCCSSPASAC